MTSDDTPAGLASWLPGFLADELRPDNIEGWVDRTSNAIRTEVPELDQYPDLVKTLDEAIREHWLAFLAAFTQPKFHFRLVDGGVRLAEDVAAHQLPIEVMIKVYRVAQQESWSYVTGVINAIPSQELDHTGVLIYFWTRASTWIDESIGASTTIYQDARTRRMQGASAQRYELVLELLQGPPADLQRTSAELGGYPLSGMHTALIFETTDAATVGELDKLAQEVAKDLGTSRPLTVHPGGRQLWVWLAHRDEPDLTKLQKAAKRLQAIDAYVVAGTPRSGPVGFAISHRDAQRALDVATRGGAWAPVMRYDEVELVALLGCDENVDRFVQRVLGGLAAPDDTTARVRETVSAFLRNGSNVEAAASDLFVHRNTVRYRLRNAEAILGHPIAHSADNLLLAIRHQELFHSDE
ncbi:MAG: PucR family transcriptional regulator [Marmoricola sp.]